MKYSKIILLSSVLLNHNIHAEVKNEDNYLSDLHLIKCEKIDIKEKINKLIITDVCKTTKTIIKSIKGPTNSKFDNNKNLNIINENIDRLTQGLIYLNEKYDNELVKNNMNYDLIRDKNIINTLYTQLIEFCKKKYNQLIEKS